MNMNKQEFFNITCITNIEYFTKMGSHTMGLNNCLYSTLQYRMYVEHAKV